MFRLMLPSCQGFTSWMKTKLAMLHAVFIGKKSRCWLQEQPTKGATRWWDTWKIESILPTRTVTFERLWPDISSCFLCKPQHPQSTLLVMLDDLINLLSPVTGVSCWLWTWRMFAVLNLFCTYSISGGMYVCTNVQHSRVGLAEYALRYKQLYLKILKNELNESDFWERIFINVKIMYKIKFKIGLLFWNNMKVFWVSMNHVWW